MLASTMHTLTPHEFVAKWKRVTARERQIYQEHFLDLCYLVGHQTPNDYDPTGTQFGFEMGAAKTSGGQGWADVAKLGYFGWEYKAKHADLDKAYEQLLLYRDALKNPPLLVVSDIDHIVIRTNYVNFSNETYTITLDDLLNPESLRILKLVFFDPEQLKPKETVESVTRDAAARFAKLADNLRKYGHDNQVIAHFLIRLLFCLFAEDIGLLPENLFPRLLSQTHRNSNDFAEVLSQLFRAMGKGGYFGADKILYFNGGLFDDDRVLPLDGADMDIIANIDALDWSVIEPSIFGTLFERGLDPAKRSQLGGHFTGKDDIMLIVEPVLMAPLRREWKELQAECIKLKQDAEALTSRRRATVTEMIGKKLRLFADKIAAIKVLDPACGSGNFLYIALRLLLDLQNEVINYSDEMGAGRFFISVTPTQLYGIEINEYAYELAQMTIQIGYIQWLRDNGYGFPNEPILRQVKNIKHMDAVLAYDENGIPVEPEWPEVDVIVGNPPFLGDKKMRSELGDKYVEDLRYLYKDRIPGQSDLVCYWFEKARAMIEQGKLKRAGLLATQGIRGGANRKVLDRIKMTGDIFWAQSDRVWVLDGATVHVSMVAFDRGDESTKNINDLAVQSINADLTTEIDLTRAVRLVDNQNLAFVGTQKGGKFDIPAKLASEMMRKTGNPNGRPNSDVIKPWVNGLDLTNRTRGFWIIDFGVDLSKEDASKYEAPFEYTKFNIKPSREETNSEERTTNNWWLHQRPRPDMREALSHLRRYIGTPRVAKHRLFVWLDVSIVPDSQVVVIALEDDYSFGVLHSRCHEIWARNTGTQLREAESGFRYSLTMTFETFPFPYPPGKEPKGDPLVHAIAQTAKELVDQRDRWLKAESLTEAEQKKRTLTNLYNQRPTWLDLAHKKLDEAVFAAYGWRSDMTDEELLEKLLALNLERSK